MFGLKGYLQLLASKKMSGANASVLVGRAAGLRQPGKYCVASSLWLDIGAERRRCNNLIGARLFAAWFPWDYLARATK